MVTETMRRAWWIVVLSLCAACPAEGGDDAGSDGGDGCDCMLGAYVPACGVDGMTYDATCGTSCVPVEIECMGECPCSAGSEGSGGMTSDGATTAAETTMGTDPCDCMLGAYVPVCGVDGMTYDATCGLECVSAEILCMGECPCPEIACGDALACGPTEPVCTTTIPGRQGSDTTYACGPVPEACAGVVPPTCACVAEAEPGCTCMEDPVGYFQVTCALP
jgi:hypothetical protein